MENLTQGISKAREIGKTAINLPGELVSIDGCSLGKGRNYLDQEGQEAVKIHNHTRPEETCHIKVSNYLVLLNDVFVRTYKEGFRIKGTDTVDYG